LGGLVPGLKKLGGSDIEDVSHDKIRRGVFDGQFSQRLKDITGDVNERLKAQGARRKEKMGAFFNLEH
jgi:hypothetical protein